MNSMVQLMFLHELDDEHHKVENNGKLEHVFESYQFQADLYQDDQIFVSKKKEKKEI